ncbi:MAG: hypothetical protein H7Y60_01175 [Rhodospirillaceae bacterium]|nr:hypothetical protein [Rhodospirillales bacterium]
MRSWIMGVTVMLLASSPAWAQAAKTERESWVPGKFTGGATVATDYIFRGISQTDEEAAIQASIEWRHDMGIFLGVWGSNVDFNDRDQASVELDWYAGYANTYRNIGYDIRAIYYSYPGADVARDYDYWELGLALTYEPLTGLGLTLGYNFSPDYFAESGTAHYLRGEASYAIAGLPVPVKLTGGIARQFINNNPVFGTPDYWHWSAGIATELKGLTLGLTYSDTDIEKRRCGASLDVCGARFIANATYAF